MKAKKQLPNSGSDPSYQSCFLPRDRHQIQAAPEQMEGSISPGESDKNRLPLLWSEFWPYIHGLFMQIRSHDLAVCSWSLPSAGIRELVQSVDELGLSHVHLALARLLFLDDKQKHFELGQLRAGGISLTAGMIAFPGEDYSTLARIRVTGGFVPDETWELRRQLTLAAARLAQELGLTLLTTHAGFIPPSDHADYPKLLKRVAEVAASLAEVGI